MHKEYEQLLGKYINGDCTEEEYALVKTHLKECDECKQALMEMEYEISYSADDEDNESEDEYVKDNSNGEKRENKTYEKHIENNYEKDEEAPEDNEESKEKKISNAKIGKKISIKNMGVSARIKLIAIICVVAMVGYFGVNALMLSGLCRDFMEFYDQAFIIPDEYISDDGVINRVRLYSYRNELKSKLSEYYIEENSDFKTMYSIVNSSLTDQASGYGYDLITETDEITSVSVKRIFLTTAEVNVKFGEGEDAYSYVISCRRKGLGWKIEKSDLKIGW